MICIGNQAVVRVTKDAEALGVPQDQVANLAGADARRRVASTGSALISRTSAPGWRKEWLEGRERPGEQAGSCSRGSKPPGECGPPPGSNPNHRIPNVSSFSLTAGMGVLLY